MAETVNMPRAGAPPSREAEGRAAGTGARTSAGQVSGWRVLAALGVGLAAGAGIGSITYYGVYFLAPAAHSAVVTQVIVVEVYGLLTAAMLVAFHPQRREPLALRFTSLRGLVLALFAWLGALAISAVVYLALRPVLGSLFDALRSVLSLATDVKRLQGRPAFAWAIAIPRGCLLVPLCEELLFRGAVLEWLRRHFSDVGAIVLAAAVFAATQVYPVVMPYAFVFGLFAGWIRVRTGSTLYPVSMHVLNNLAFLCLGLLLLR